MITREFRRAVERVLGGWRDWTPTYGASGSMTYTSVTTTFARYWQVGRTVFYEISANGTTGGVADISLTFTLPVAAADSNAASMGSTLVLESGGVTSTGYSFRSAVDTVTVRKYDRSNWALGAGAVITVTGFYEI